MPHTPTSLKTHLAYPSKTPPFLTSFCRNPKGVTFENQQENEKILLLVRKHWITNVLWILLTLLFALLPFGLPLVLPLFQIDFIVIPERFLFIGFLFYYLILFGYMIIRFTTWFFHMGLLTTNRIVDIDFSHGTYKNIGVAPIESVEDVEYNQGGFFRNLFDFGNVFIQTEGTKPNLEFESVPHPGSISDMILDLKEAAPDRD